MVRYSKLFANMTMKIEDLLLFVVCDDILVVLCTWHTPYVPLGLIYVSELLLLVLSKFINIKTVIRYT